MEYLTNLDRALTAIHGDSEAGPAVLISALGGAGGIGKTWLALHWAHRHAHRFPDGELFVDLRGFSPDGQPLHPAAAVRGFIDALGVEPDRLPADLDAQTALYRSLVADKRMLIVLDNAATTDQVTPLLPGASTCTVLVTGRHTLTSLIDRYGARHLRLDVLTRGEARALLAERLGVERAAAEPDAVDELIELCGGYPLALAISARYAATRPQVPLTELAAELRELGLDMLDDDDPAASLPTVLSWSLRGLTLEQRQLFMLSGIAPGPDIGLPAAVSLTGMSTARTRMALRTLENASLLERHAADRYTMHDLIRSYATGLARDLPEQTRQAALDRVVDFYLHTAYTAARLLDGHPRPLRLNPPTPGAQPLPLSDASAAMAWLDAHHLHLLAAQHTAATRRRHHVVWQLAWSLSTFHGRRWHRHDDLAAWRAAVNAAEHLPVPIRVFAHRRLGLAHVNLARHEEAVDELHRALALAERHHDPTELALTHRYLTMAWEARGDMHKALMHARHALDLHRALGQPEREADGLNAVGWCAARIGDYDTARTHCQAALVLHRQHHNAVGEAHTLDSLGFIDHHSGHHQQAVNYYRQALVLFGKLADTASAADTLDRLGHPHTALSQYEQARTTWQEAVELYRQQGRDSDAERVQQQLGNLNRNIDISSGASS